MTESVITNIDFSHEFINKTYILVFFFIMNDGLKEKEKRKIKYKTSQK